MPTPWATPHAQLGTSAIRTLARRLYQRRKDRRARLERRMLCESLEQRQLLAADWRNPVVSLDASADGRFNSFDAVVILRDLLTNGQRVLAGPRPDGAAYVDVNGNQRAGTSDVVQVLQGLFTGFRLPLSVSERNTLVDQRDITITLPGEQEQRTYRASVAATFDADIAQGSPDDVLAVYLIDPQNPAETLLGQGTTGSPLFTLSNGRAQYSPGRVRWDGAILEINLPVVDQVDTALLRFQLIRGDATSDTSVIIQPLTNELTIPLPASASFPATAVTAAAPGPAVDVTQLAAATNVQLIWDRLQYNSATGRYAAQLRIKNDGPSLGSQVVAVLSNLPAGVSVLNASGTTTDGSPYWNLQPAISRGGLASRAASDPILVEVENPNNTLFFFDIDVFANLNTAPALSPLAEQTVMPGATHRIVFDATDVDGDALTYSIRGPSNMPTALLQADGVLVVKAEPDQLGTYEFDVVASDGALEAVQPVRLHVVADPNTVTRVTGYVLDVNQQPIEGVPVELAGFSATSGADGKFTISLPTMKTPTEAMNIEVPLGDPQLDPFVTGTQEIRFRRARFDVTTGDSVQNPRQHPNLVSSFLDGSIVYGSDQIRADALRTFVDGKLKTSSGNLLPLNDEATFPGLNLENDNEGRLDPADLFVAGDVRANENVALLSLHTILVREHNRLAGEIQAASGSLSDEEIYQQARRLLGAMLQHITYTEYLPLILGAHVIAPYQGYQPDVNPQVSALFSVAAFRLGHTQLNGELKRLDANGQSLPGGSLEVRSGFFATQPVKDDGIEPYLRGLAATAAREIDLQVVDDLRNFLFGPPGAGGMDLAAMNIQRGRDMGLPSYNDARQDFGLPPVTSFEEISSDAETLSRLAAAYASVEEIDVWVGAIAEDHVEGAMVGPLLQRIWKDQFERTRDGDRYWYENEQFTGSELAMIRATTLEDLLERNAPGVDLPESPLTTGGVPEGPAPAGSAAAGPVLDFRTITGQGNHPQLSQLGSTGTNLLREFTDGYADGISSPGGADRPGPREISNAAFAESQIMPNAQGGTSLLVFWGQLLSHDLGLTPGGVSDTLKILGNERVPTGPETYPFVAERMDLMLGHATYPGVENVIDRPIFLPVLDMANGMTIDPSQTTMVQTPAIPNLMLEVAPNNLFDRQGNAFTGMMTITEVPRNLTPAALPPEAIPELVITVQPADLVFTTPAPITFPNRGGSPPGTEMELYSVSPITGEFELVGMGKVSEDGQRIETVSGGLRNSSWGFFFPGFSEPRNPTLKQSCTDCEPTTSFGLGGKNKDKEKEDWDIPSRWRVPDKPAGGGGGGGDPQAELGQGSFLLPVDLVAYESCGVIHTIGLTYDSLRADVRPIVNVGVNSTAGFGDRFLANTMVGKATLSRGDYSLQSPGLPAGQSAIGPGPGLTGGENFWTFPESRQAMGGIQFDLRDQPSGVYDYQSTAGAAIRSGTDELITGQLGTAAGKMLVVNGIGSIFGNGWGLNELQQLVANPDGSMLLVRGDGTETVFDAPGGRGAAGASRTFGSQPGDYSTLEAMPDGTFQRTTPGKTVYKFDGSGQLMARRERDGLETQYVHDAGKLTKIIDPSGLETTFDYTGKFVSRITDPGGRETLLEHDSTGNLTRIVMADGSSQSFAYNEKGLLTEITDLRGFVTTVEYDRSGQLVSITTPDNATQSVAAFASRGLYDTAQTGNISNQNPVAADASRRLAYLTDGNGNVTELELDANGQVQRVVDLLGQQTAYTRNADNRISEVQSGRGDTSSIAYDRQGNQILWRDEGGSGGTAGDRFADPVLFAAAAAGEVVGADVNGDGLGDVVYSARSDAGTFGVAIKLGTPEGRLGAPVFVELATTEGVIGQTAGFQNLLLPNPWTLADLDGDGDQDLLFAEASAAQPMLRILLNDGDAAFTPVADVPLAQRPILFAIDDLNDDQRLDLVVAHDASPGLSVLLGNVFGLFDTSTPVNVPATASAIALGDLNGDGLPDLAMASHNGTSSVAVLEGDGAGGFLAATILATNQRVSSLQLADFNNDGPLDIVAAGVDLDQFGNSNPANRFLQTFTGNGDLTFTSQLPNRNIPFGPERIRAADLDGDNDLDLGMQAGVTVAILNNLGTAFFETGQVLGVPPDAMMALADATSDGILDLVTTQPQNDSFNMTVRRGHADRTFGDVRFTGLTVAGAPEGVAIGDVNGDSLPDIVTGAASGSIVLMAGDGQGGILSQQRLADFVSPLFRLTDINGDQLLDLITIVTDSGGEAEVGSGSSNIEIRLGDGLGTFDVFSTIDFLPGAVTDLEVGDLDGDGTIDIAVSILVENELDFVHELHVFLNDGSEFFSPPLSGSASFVLGENFVDLVVGDLNGDSAAEVLVSMDDELLVFPGVVGQGTADAAVIADPGFGGPLLLGDFNADQLLDVIQTSETPERSRVLLGNGDGTFANGASLEISRIATLATADLDGDGDLDVLAAQHSGANLVLLLNDGDGNFDERLDYSSSRPAARVALGDVNGDGVLDVVFSADNANGVFVNLGRDPGTIAVRRYTYDDTFNQITSFTDELGRQTLYEVDPATGHRLSMTEVVGALGGGDDRVTQYEYNSLGLVSRQIDPLGRITEYDYDANCRLIMATFAVGTADEAIQQYEYDAIGNVTAFVDENGNRSDYEYDLRNRLVRKTLPDPDGPGPLVSPVIQYTYDAAGNLLSETDSLGNVMHYEFDSMNRLVTKITALGEVTRMTYDAAGNMLSVTDARGRTTRFGYDARNRLSRIDDPVGGVTRMAYDENGNPVEVTDPLGNVTRMEYDLRDRMVARIDAQGQRASFQYDAADNVTSVTDRNGRTWSFAYDEFNRLVSARDPLQHVSLYVYDAVGNNTATIDPLGRVIQYRYDARDRLVERIDPLGGSQTLTYDPAGNIIRQSDELGREYTAVYDGLHRVTQVNNALGDSRQYTYDVFGNLTSLVDELGRTTTYRYDALNRVVESVNARGDAQQYAYDSVGNLTRIIDELGRVSQFDYDGLDRIVRITNPIGGVLLDTYDLAGNLVSSTDELGRSSTMEYDSLNRLVRETNALGGVITWSYDAEGNIVETRDELNHATRFRYDGLDRLVGVTDALGGNFDIQRDAVGNTLRITDALGRSTQFVYDALDRTVIQRNALGGERHFVYDAVGNLLQETNERGHSTAYTYDALNRLVEITDALGNTSHNAYDAAGNYTRHTDRLGNVTQMTYDDLNRLATITDPLGGVRRFQYDAVSNPIRVTDELQRDVQYAYDGLNRLISITTELGFMASTTYDAVGNVRSITDPRGNRTEYSYDALNRRIRQEDALGGVQQFTYDAAHRTTAITDELNRTTNFAYDSLNRRISTTDPLGHTSTWSYDAVGNLLMMVDPLGNEVQYSYDALHRRAGMTDADGGQTIYQYDATHNLSHLEDPTGNLRQFTYDALNRLVEETDASSVSRSFQYDAEGNLLRKTDRNGRTVEYTYDALYRRTAEDWLDGGGLSLHHFDFQYDAASQLLTAGDSDSQEAFAYDLDGRTVRVTSSRTSGLADVVQDYTYDSMSNRLSRTEIIGGTTAATTTYAYDALNRVTVIGQSGPGVADKRVEFGYDAASQMATISRFADLAGNQQVSLSQYTYDAAGRLTDLQHVHESSPLAQYQLVFDAANRITQFSSADGVANYTYDERGQLLAADHSIQSDETYTYDANGNRVDTGYVTGTDNRLESDGIFDYVYDGEGNRILRSEIATGETAEYEWDYRNRLTRVIARDSSNMVLSETTFKYDAFDRRIEKTFDPDGPGAQAPRTDHFVYDGVNIALQFDTSANLAHRYLHGPLVDQVLADETAGGQVVWPHADHQGTIRDLVDSAGNVVNHISYDSFGRRTAETNAAVDHLYSYTGREFDEETGSYYYRARYYDAEVGRFLSEDPLGYSAGDMNLYRYTNNSPTNFIDPFGLEFTMSGNSGSIISQGSPSGGTPMFGTGAAAGDAGVGGGGSESGGGWNGPWGGKDRPGHCKTEEEKRREEEENLTPEPLGGRGGGGGGGGNSSGPSGNAGTADAERQNRSTLRMARLEANQVTSAQADPDLLVKQGITRGVAKSFEQGLWQTAKFAGGLLLFTSAKAVGNNQLADHALKETGLPALASAMTSPKDTWDAVKGEFDSKMTEAAEAHQRGQYDKAGQIVGKIAGDVYQAAKAVTDLLKSGVRTKNYLQQKQLDARGAQIRAEQGPRLAQMRTRLEATKTPQSVPGNQTPSNVPRNADTPGPPVPHDPEAGRDFGQLARRINRVNNLKRTNPNYATDPMCQVNCSRNAIMGEKLLKGMTLEEIQQITTLEAGPGGLANTAEEYNMLFSGLYNSEFQHMPSLAQAEAELAAAGEGSRAILWAERPGNEMGHMINVTYEQGAITYWDYQIGSIVSRQHVLDNWSLFWSLRTSR